MTSLPSLPILPRMNMTKQEYISSLRPGTKVTFYLPAGHRSFALKRAKVVLAMGTHVVVNMGGRHGTPAVVTAQNVVLPKP